MQADDRQHAAAPRITASASSAPVLGAVPRVRWTLLRNSDSASTEAPSKPDQQLDSLRQMDAVLAQKREKLLQRYPGWTTWSDERADQMPALHRHRRLVRLQVEAWREHHQPESRSLMRWPRAVQPDPLPQLNSVQPP